MSKNNNEKIVAFVGLAGSGKVYQSTTLSKKVTQKFILEALY